MAKYPFEHFEIPNEMRAFAEDSVLQARKAFGGFIEAANKAVGKLHDHTTTAHGHARGVTEKAMTFAEQNVASSFEFAQRLVRAKDAQEVLKLQADYVQQQMKVLTEQAAELGEDAARMAKTAATP